MESEINNVSSVLQLDVVNLLVFLAIVIVGTYFGSLLREYGKRRGNQAATKADIESILEHVGRSTEIKETIKNEIEHGVWRTKELELLKREKLESYLINHYQAVENLSKEMKRGYFREEGAWNEAAESMASMLQKLYLPELDSVHRQYLAVSSEFMTWYAKGREELLGKMKLGAQIPIISSEHMDQYPELLRKINAVTILVEARCAEVASELNSA